MISRAEYPFKPLRPRVPAGHAALAVEHEDGVVGHGVDHQPKPFLALAKRLFGPAAIGQVARDLHEPDHRTIRADQARDDDVGPEATAVAPHPPAFLLDAAVPGRLRQEHVGPAGRPILLGVETGEALPDDLPRSVPLDVSGPGVPGEDYAVRIEEENCVVPDAVRDGAESRRRKKFLEIDMHTMTLHGVPLSNHRRNTRQSRIAQRALCRRASASARARPSGGASRQPG